MFGGSTEVFMQILLALFLIALVFIAPYPVVVWLLGRSPLAASRGLAVLLAAGVGVGVLTWLMMVEGMLGIPYTLPAILIPFVLIFALGTFVWWRGGRTRTMTSPPEPAISPLLSRLGWAVITLVGAAVLFNALYWPFYKADAVGIYADQAHFMYFTGGLIPLSLPNYSYYQAYPMLVQLSYTFTYFAAASENVYLAKLIPTLLGLGCLGVVYMLGKALYNPTAGWLAVILLALTPLFGRWASSGYADLPMAFYYVLAALFAWRAWQADGWVDALFSGIAIGLGAWTKNAILPGMALWFVYLLLGLLMKRLTWRSLLAASAAALVVAAPWYIRNVVEAGLLMPATVWSEQAGWTLENLLVFITHPENFAFTGWLIVTAGALALVNFAREPRLNTPSILILVFTLPFFGFWWVLASYDRRFLLYFLPLLVVLAAGNSLLLWQRIPASGQRLLRWGFTIAALAMTVYILSISIDYKNAILRDPFMSDAAKQEVVKSTLDDE